MSKAKNLLKEFNKCKVANVVRIIPPENDLYRSITGLVGNRDVKDPNVTKIIKRMKKLGFFDFMPIVVNINEDGTVMVNLDGQHRLKAAACLGIPIMAINCQKDFSLNPDITISLNSGKTNWGLLNYADFWAAQEDA